MKLPIFYYDNTSMTAIYTASTEKMSARLPSGLLHPVEIYPGRCLAAVSAFEYRETDIGPYNEFSVATLVTRGKRGLPGLTALSQLLRNEMHVYILTLPVDSELACRGGRDLSGYPKFLADFEWSDHDRFSSCRISVNGKLLARMRGKKLPTSQGRVLHSVLYTRFNNYLLNANLYIDQRRFGQSFDRGSAEIEIGDGHELCELLEDLKLGARPIAYQYSPHSRAILFDSKNLMDQ
ncbi:MAG: acetoacetate decarboxylase family protein [Thermodesulfobacteriota bacterium]